VRALVQRVARAEVRVDGEVVGSISAGLCAFVGVTHTDDAAVAVRLAEKLWHLRVFDDEQANMGRSVAEGSQQVLVVSQFTLYGDTRKGRRPSWIDAARPEQADGRHRPVPRRHGRRAGQRRTGHADARGLITRAAA
jgi:D-tyrosyl-tRNA(Tyr) deacylase